MFTVALGVYCCTGCLLLHWGFTVALGVYCKLNPEKLAKTLGISYFTQSLRYDATHHLQRSPVAGTPLLHSLDPNIQRHCRHCPTLQEHRTPTSLWSLLVHPQDEQLHAHTLPLLYNTKMAFGVKCKTNTPKQFCATEMSEQHSP